MVTIVRLVVLLSVLLAAGACQSTKSDAEIALQPGSPELEQLYQEGRAAYLSEDYQTAAAAFERVVENDPAHIKALINWAASLSRGGDPRAAIPKYEQALARDPNHAWALYNLGVALQRLGEHEAAIARYNQAVERDPDLLTPEMQRYLKRWQPRLQDNEIKLQNTPPPSTPR